MNNPIIPTDIGAIIIGLVVSVLVFVLIFLALRWLNLWYWKINHRLEAAEETNRLLRQLLDELKARNADAPITKNGKPLEKPE